MSEFDSYGRRIRVLSPRVTARWLQRNIRADVALTLTLEQRREFHDGDRPIRISGSAEDYEWAFGKIVHALSGQFLGRAYRRYEKLIPSFAALEGDGDVKRKHVHAGLRCPDHVDRNEFIGAVYYCSAKVPWVMDNVLVEPITGNWTGYTLKEGSEALLVGSISF